MVKPNICIIGPGVVGWATGKVFIDKGFDVSFIGRGREKIEKLIAKGYRAHQWDEFVNGNYDFDISILTVPTPTEDGKINLDAMDKASKELGKHLRHTRKYHLVVVKSTVVPGTTEDLVVSNIEKYSGKKVGKDFGACMNPEYLREETAYDDTLNAWLVVIGEYDKKSGDMLEQLYKGFDCPLFRCKISEAEMQKYVHNLYNAAKISFFNEMRQIAKEIGVDAEKVFKFTTLSAEGMWNPKYGIREKGPFMGSCLPKDTKAFFHWAKKKGFSPMLLKSVIDVNEELKTKVALDKEVKVEYTL